MAASKLPRVGTTIFTVMSQLALKHGAVNLGQGFPDFNCDERLQQCLAHVPMRIRVISMTINSIKHSLL